MILPVELPPWLPGDVVQDMVLRYRQHLRRQLMSLLTMNGYDAVQTFLVGNDLDFTSQHIFRWWPTWFQR
jgi:hypothetical protein